MGGGVLGVRYVHCAVSGRTYTSRHLARIIICDLIFGARSNRRTAAYIRKRQPQIIHSHFAPPITLAFAEDEGEDDGALALVMEGL